MQPDYELLLQRLSDLLSGGDKAYTGRVVKLGKTVQVGIGGGRYVTAENLGVVVPGEVGVILANGKYYVYPVGTNEVVQRRVLQSRRFRQVTPKVENIYPFKVLFSVIENGVRKFYISGDRAGATFLFESKE